MANKRFWLGMLAMVLVFGMTVIGCGNDDENDPKNEDNFGTVQDIFQGTYNVHGYYHNFDEILYLWADLTDPSYDSLKADYPIVFTLTSDSITFTGGMFQGKTAPAKTVGSDLIILDNTEITLGHFSMDEFHMTYGLDYASLGAYIVYRK